MYFSLIPPPGVYLESGEVQMCLCPRELCDMAKQVVKAAIAESITHSTHMETLRATRFLHHIFSSENSRGMTPQFKGTYRQRDVENALHASHNTERTVKSTSRKGARAVNEFLTNRSTTSKDSKTTKVVIESASGKRSATKKYSWNSFTLAERPRTQKFTRRRPK